MEKQDNTIKFLYSREDSNALKGIAILLVLVHHILNAKYPFVLKIIPEAIIADIVSLAKVSVYLFFFVSGLGMYRSFAANLQKKTGAFLKESEIQGTNQKVFPFMNCLTILKTSFQFVLSHFLKLYQMYWFIYLLVIPMGVFFGRAPMEIYSGSLTNVLFDFFGLSFVFGKKLAVATWWYIGMLFLFYTIMPLVYFLLRKLPRKLTLLVTLAVVVLSFFFRGTGKNYLIYFVPFLLGMVAAKENFLETFRVFSSKTSFRKRMLFFALLALLISYGIFRIRVMSQNIVWYRMDYISMIIIILLADNYLPKEASVYRFLQSVGTHSGNIYLFHAFIYSLYFTEVIYSFSYALFVYLFAVFLFLGISKLIELIKDRTGYNRFFEKLIKLVNDW